jgi:hypothetical protein
VSKLITTISEYKATSSQIAALEWLQKSTGAGRYSTFTSFWRQGLPAAPIKLQDVWKYYKGLPHQQQAIEYLEGTTGESVITEFLRLWKLNSNSSIMLAVPYFNQVDNRYEPMRTCSTSSHAMAAKFLGAKISGDDDYYARFVKGQFDSTDWDGHTRALAKLGIKSVYHQDLGFDDLDRELERGKPIVIGILHRGTLADPRGGHVLVVIGKNETSTGYFVNDPFGSILDGYQGPVENGKGALYSRAILKARWTVGGGGGWGRLFI